MRMWLLVTATAVSHTAGLYKSEYRSCLQSRSAAQDKRLWPDNTHIHWQQHARCSVLLQQHLAHKCTLASMDGAACMGLISLLRTVHAAVWCRHVFLSLFGLVSRELV